jgi:hypothetical protein
MPLDPQLDPVFSAAGQTYNVDPLLLKAMAGQESGGDPNIVSPKGATGLMQLMPDTAKELGVTDTNNPIQSIFGGAQYLSQGLDKYKDPAHALMYYHGGPDESQWGEKTAAYPGQVLARYSPPRPQVAASPQAAVSGTDALAAVGRPAQSTAPQQSAQPQMAQTGGMSDEDLLNGFVKGTLPFMPKPAAAASPQSGAPSPSSGSAAPAFNVGELINQYNQLRSFPMGMPAANSILQILQKMAPEGYQLNQNGSLALRPGYAQQANTLAASQAAGKDKQIIGPGGVVSPMPGGPESDAATAGAVKGAQEEEQIQITRDGAIYKGRVYIGHAPKMTDVVDAQGNKYPAFTPPIGPTAPGLAPPSGGGGSPNLPAGAAPPPGAVTGSPSELGPGPHEALSKGEELSSETYNEARKSFLGNQPAIQNLKNYLEAASKVGTGRGTNFSGNAAAWLKSSGVDPDKLSLADPAQVQIMQKAGNQMLAAAVRAISSRPAFADFGVLEKGLPDPEKQPEAQKQIAASLLGRMTWENQLFKDWDADRRKTNSPSTFDMPSWVEAHPTQAFQSSAFEQMPNIPQRGVIGKPEAPAQGKRSTYDLGTGEFKRIPQ